MSFVLLHADRLRSVATDDPLVPAAEAERVRDAAGLLVAAGRLREVAEHDIAAARDAARAAAAEQGLAQGLAEAKAHTTEALARLGAQAAEREQARSRDVARLAVEVVRRIAGELPDGALVAGLAERAAAGLTADQPATVRVAPAAADAVRARLADRPGLMVEGDATLEADDCVLETALGRTHAGLETQLSAVERAWTAR